MLILVFVSLMIGSIICVLMDFFFFLHTISEFGMHLPVDGVTTDFSL